MYTPYQASKYEKDPQIADPTMYILQKNLNPNPTHDAFRFITCVNWLDARDK